MRHLLDRSGASSYSTHSAGRCMCRDCRREGTGSDSVNDTKAIILTEPRHAKYTPVLVVYTHQHLKRACLKRTKPQRQTRGSKLHFRVYSIGVVRCLSLVVPSLVHFYQALIQFPTSSSEIPTPSSETSTSSSDPGDGPTKFGRRRGAPGYSRG